MLGGFLAGHALQLAQDDNASILGGQAAQFLVQHGLAISAGVAIYVAASNLVPELQGKHGWTMPAAFFAGALVFFLTKLLLESAV